MQKNDLSLLTTLSAKERKMQNDKGIFTVLQLSYTFRSPPRSNHALPKHQAALKALAIRKKQIDTLGTPSFSLLGTPVYLDVEGDPDRDFYYLIGRESNLEANRLAIRSGRIAKMTNGEYGLTFFTRLEDSPAHA